jgi:hypothetical protein
MNRLLIALLVCMGSSSAHAGSCVPCTDSSQCPMFGGNPSFCVQYPAGQGPCLPNTEVCCPGQGCSTFGGRPSCETANPACTVVSGPVDGGASDGGISDGGVSDGGNDLSSVADLSAHDGAVLRDLSTPDAAIPTPAASSGGCGCQPGGASTISATAILCAVGLLELLRRRRRP